MFQFYLKKELKFQVFSFHQKFSNFKTNFYLNLIILVLENNFH